MIFLFILFFCLEARVHDGYTYKEVFHDMPKNHFDFTSSETYKHRTLIYSDHYNESDPVVFVYTGNEGDIVDFYNNTGIIFELAEYFDALVLFIEHRYFGKSIPDYSSFRYFSVEQVLEDFITILISLRDNVFHWNQDTTPIITFGGSYGGMLASWGKMKYNEFYTGALASSAPNLHFEGFVDPGLFAKIVTESFSTFGCNKDRIQPSLISLNHLIEKGGEKEFGYLQNTFRTCKKITSVEDAKKIYELIFLSLQSLAVVNYPTASKFFQPLPPFPVKVSCSKFLDQKEGIEGLYEILNVYFNSSGTVKCMDTEKWTEYDIYMSYNWRFGRCSMIVMPMEYNGNTDFFYPPRTWNLGEFESFCKQEYPEVNFSPFWITNRYHGENLIGAENIIFSNGGMDPWSSGGVYEKNLKFSPTCTSIVIEGAAHHEDLRFSSSDDPKELILAREQEKKIIQQWILEKKGIL